MRTGQTVMILFVVFSLQTQFDLSLLSYSKSYCTSYLYYLTFVLRRNWQSRNCVIMQTPVFWECWNLWGYKLSLYSIYCHFVQWRNQWLRNCVMPELSRRLFWGVVKFMRVLVAPHVMMQIGCVWLLYKSYPSWIHVFTISSFKFFPNNHSL